MLKLSKIMFVLFLFGCGSSFDSGRDQRFSLGKEAQLHAYGPRQNSVLVVDPVSKKVLDLKKRPLTLRGIQVPLVYRTTEKASSNPEVLRKISELGFNLVRVTWGSVSDEDYDNRQEKLKSFIEEAQKQKLMVMLEVHNVTGKNDGLDKVVDYWLSLYPLLKPYERFLMINIANEWGGNDLAKDVYRRQYREAVQRLRQGGYRLPLVIDAAGWGQDITYLTDESFWSQLLDLDRSLSGGSANLMFGIHLYGNWGLNRGDQGARFGLKEDFVSFHRSAPVFLGEFGWNKPGNPDKAKISLGDIVKLTQDENLHLNIYSWGGNNPHYRNENGAVFDYSYLDFVKSDYIYGAPVNGVPRVVEYRFRNGEFAEFGWQLIKDGKLIVSGTKAEF